MIRNLDWMDAAHCTTADPAVFFPDEKRPLHKAAKAICNRCPVRPQCADYAEHLENGAAHQDRWGTWGSHTPSARARLARAAGKPTKQHTQYAERRDTILRLHQSGWDAETIASHVGCTSRTVWRITKQYRQQFEEAA